MKKCNMCNGLGNITQRFTVFNEIRVVKVQCPKCYGKGKK